MKMYSLSFGYTGSVSVMCESREKAFELLKGYELNSKIEDIEEFGENEVFVNYGDE